MYSLAKVARAMNACDMVDWDRCARDNSRGTAYGWVARADGRQDFVVLHWNSAGYGCTTSSAEHAAEIGRRLAGVLGPRRIGGGPDAQYRRVAEVFGSMVERTGARLLAPPAPEAAGDGRAA